MNPIDIRPCDLDIVKNILRKNLAPDTRVWVFGSRATWKTKRSSDLDLAIDAGRKLSKQENMNLANEFDESDLPYKVDIVDMRNLSETFKKIVERDRVELDWKNHK